MILSSTTTLDSTTKATSVKPPARRHTPPNNAPQVKTAHGRQRYPTKIKNVSSESYPERSQKAAEGDVDHDRDHDELQPKVTESCLMITMSTTMKPPKVDGVPISGRNCPVQRMRTATGSTAVSPGPGPAWRECHERSCRTRSRRHRRRSTTATTRPVLLGPTKLNAR